MSPGTDHVEDRTGNHSNVGISASLVGAAIVKYRAVARAVKFHERYRTVGVVWRAGWEDQRLTERIRNNTTIRRRKGRLPFIPGSVLIKGPRGCGEGCNSGGEVRIASQDVQ